MRITGITVWKLELPFDTPYYLSGGRLKVESLDSTFVRIDTDEGIAGWGEACPWGHTYIPAHGNGVRAGIQTIAPYVLGKDPRAIEHLNLCMDIALPGHNYVKSPIDMACWDILGQYTEMPLWMLFGGQEASKVPLNSSISTGSAEEMVKRILRASAEGYRTHSAKIGGADVAKDIERMEAISVSLPKGENVTFDINRAWTPGLAIQVLNSASAKSWIEQPCETLAQCTQVAKRVNNPIMLDECMHSFDDHLEAWKANACEGVKVKPNRVGGLTKAKFIRDFGVKVGWQMHIEDVGGTVLADTAIMHLASSTPKENRLATWICHPHFVNDPIPNQGARNQNGFATPPDSPGIGVKPDANQLGEPVFELK